MDQFQKAVYLISEGPEQSNITNDIKLKFYALYKQANFGDCQIPEPWFNLVEKAKRNAWYALKGMEPEIAKQKYVELLTTLYPTWLQDPCFPTGK